VLSDLEIIAIHGDLRLSQTKGGVFYGELWFHGYGCPMFTRDGKTVEEVLRKVILHLEFLIKRSIRAIEES